MERIKGIARSCRRARITCARREGLDVLRGEASRHLEIRPKSRKVAS